MPTLNGISRRWRPRADGTPRPFAAPLLWLVMLALLAGCHGEPRVLQVGADKPYRSLGAAVAEAGDGDTILVDAGTYLNDFVTVTASLHIVGVGGKARFEGNQHIPNGKAILIDRAEDLTLENLQFVGAEAHDGNGAGIRYEWGTLTVRNCDFIDNEEGILGGRVPGGRVFIDGSNFQHNGSGDGQTHGLYIGVVDSLTVTNSNFVDTVLGSHLKSRAARTDIANSRFIDGPGGNTNYDIDLCDGGIATVRNSVIAKSAEADNRALIHFGGEVSDPEGSLLVEDNKLSSDRPGSVAVLNQTRLPVKLVNNGIGRNVQMVFDGNPGEELSSWKLQG
jgi:hypothetical protein